MEANPVRPAPALAYLPRATLPLFEKARSHVKSSNALGHVSGVTDERKRLSIGVATLFHCCTASDSSGRDIISNHTLQWEQMGSRYCVFGSTDLWNVKLMEHDNVAGVGRTGPSLQTLRMADTHRSRPSERGRSSLHSMHVATTTVPVYVPCPFNLLPSLMAGDGILALRTPS